MFITTELTHSQPLMWVLDGPINRYSVSI